MIYKIMFNVIFLKKEKSCFLRLSYLVAVKLRLPQNPRNLIKPARYLKKKKSVFIIYI